MAEADYKFRTAVRAFPWIPLGAISSPAVLQVGARSAHREPSGMSRDRSVRDVAQYNNLCDSPLARNSRLPAGAPCSRVRHQVPVLRPVTVGWRPVGESSARHQGRRPTTDLADLVKRAFFLIAALATAALVLVWIAVNRLRLRRRTTSEGGAN